MRMLAKSRNTRRTGPQNQIHKCILTNENYIVLSCIKYRRRGTTAPTPKWFDLVVLFVHCFRSCRNCSPRASRGDSSQGSTVARESGGARTA